VPGTGNGYEFPQSLNNGKNDRLINWQD
jgi:hypothetical protein